MQDYSKYSKEELIALLKVSDALIDRYIDIILELSKDNEILKERLKLPF